jgi:uncharacterized membrane protein
VVSRTKPRRFFVWFLFCYNALMSVQKSYHFILMAGSVVGLVASFLLTLSTLELFKNPSANIPCNLNPFVSCTNAALAWQGSVFGFPNSILGLIAFSMLFAIGVMLYSGGRAKKPLWLLVNLGLLAAVGFVHWFIYQSLYSLGTLCVYCMTVWVVAWPLFIYTTVWNLKENHFSLSVQNSKFAKLIETHHLALTLGWYLLIILLILMKFKDFFFS